MEPSSLILLLFACLLLMLWALKIGLEKVEASLLTDAQLRGIRSRSNTTPHFDQPEAVADVIGYYMGRSIYHSITIGGVTYCFDHIEAPDNLGEHTPDQRCLEPGIVYLAR